MLPTDINPVKARKAELKKQAEAMLASAVSANRNLNETEDAKYNEFVTEIKGCEAMITRHAELSGFTVENLENGTDRVRIDPAARGEKKKVKMLPWGTEAYAEAFEDYHRFGHINAAALNIGTGSQGGYAVPLEFDTKLVEKLVNANVMRQVATVITTQSDRKIAVENSVGSADWTAETVAAHNNDSSDDDTLGQVTLSAYKLTRVSKVSNELLEDAFFDIQGWQVRKFGNAFGLAEEAAFVDGAGTTRPTGVTRGATLGVTCALHNDIAVDEILGTFHALKRAYRSNATWLMNDSTALLVRKKKDTTGQYIWQPGLQPGLPDVLLGKPVAISDFVPSADSAGKKALLFGDMSYYVIADRAPRTFQRLQELYAINGQVGFIANERTDGVLTLAEAVVYAAMGSAS